MKKCNATLVLWVAIVLGSAANAEIFRVEKDGTGDFTIIQDAVEAASDGDTIEIGPGRYADFFDAPYDIQAVVYIEDKSLSFVGSGQELTVIGPENYGDIDGHQVYGVFVYSDGLTSAFTDLAFDNVQQFGVRIHGAGRIEVDRCTFRDSSGGIFGSFANGGWIRDSQFRDLDTDYGWTAIMCYEPSSGIQIERCEFSDCRGGIRSYWGGCVDTSIDACSFQGGRVGVGFTDGASGSVTNCVFVGQSLYALVGNSPGDVVIEYCQVEMVGEDGFCLCAFASPGNYYLRNNVFLGNYAVIGIYDPRIGWDCRDNTFLRNGNETYFVRPAPSPFYSGPVITLDFANNWWGTDDPDEVAEWIHDYEDDPEHHYIVEFLPMNGAVATEGRSWSEVKSLFR